MVLSVLSENLEENPQNVMVWNLISAIKIAKLRTYLIFRHTNIAKL